MIIDEEIHYWTIDEFNKFINSLKKNVKSKVISTIGITMYCLMYYILLDYVEEKLPH